MLSINHSTIPAILLLCPLHIRVKLFRPVTLSPCNRWWQWFNGHFTGFGVAVAAWQERMCFTASPDACPALVALQAAIQTPSSRRFTSGSEQMGAFTVRHQCSILVHELLLWSCDVCLTERCQWTTRCGRHSWFAPVTVADAAWGGLSLLCCRTIEHEKCGALDPCKLATISYMHRRLHVTLFW